ncbi:MAG: NADH-quinone oxidoreductase subunit N [Cyclobacteriaceae bacterium]
MMEFSLQQVIEEIALLRFEAALILGSLILLVFGMLSNKEVTYKVIFSATLLVSLFMVDVRDIGAYANGAVSIDALSGILKILFAFISLWIVFFHSSKRRYEHYFLLLAIVIGSSLMLSANHLLLFYLAIELTSLSSYLITGFSFSRKGYEAAIKYLLFGGVSSAIMIYGISILYGLSGSLSISEMVITTQMGPLYHVGMICLVGGLFFKVGLVPYHFWVPSTYQEAPTDGVAILSIVPKIAGFALLHRLLVNFELLSDPMYRQIIAALGIATVLMGTFGALRQDNIKRMIAYGAIAHSGLVLPTLLISGEQGGLAFIWYVTIYAIMTMAIFMIASMYEDFGIKDVKDMKGIGIQFPIMGTLTLLILIAQIGLPPTAGFTAKFYLFSAIWNEYQTSGATIMLIYLIVGLLSVVLALFYYLKIPFHSFLGTAESPYFGDFSIISRSVVTIFTIMVLWIFISPEFLNKIAFNINFIGW